MQGVPHIIGPRTARILAIILALVAGVSSAWGQSIRQDSLTARKWVTQALEFEQDNELDSAARYMDLAHAQYDSIWPHAPVPSIFRHIAFTGWKAADYYTTLGQYPRAQTLLDSTQAFIARQEGDSAHALISLYNVRGHLFKALGRYPSAISNYEQALFLTELHEGATSVRRAPYKMNIGNIYQRQGKIAEAEQAVLASLHIYEMQPTLDSAEYAKVLNSLGIIFAQQSKLEESIDYFHRALAFNTLMSPFETPETGSNYTNLARAYRELGDYPTALAYNHKALQVFRQTLGESHDRVAVVYNNMGSIYLMVNDLSKALDYYFRSLDMRIALFGTQHPAVAQSYNNLGNVFSQLGKYDEAIKYLNQGMDIARQALGDNHYYVAAFYTNLGTQYMALGDHQRGIHSFEQSIAINLKRLNGNHPQLGMDYNALADAYLTMGDLDKAEDYFSRAQRIFRRNTGPKGGNLARTYNKMGKLYQKKEDYRAADSLFQLAMQANLLDMPDVPLDVPPSDAQLIEEPLTVSIVRNRGNLRAEGWLQGTSLESAHEFYDYGIALVDKIRDGFSQESSRLQFQEYAWQMYEGGIRNCLNLYKETGEKPYLDQAFHWLEKSKATQLRQALRESKARAFTGVPDTLISMEEDLRIRLAYLERRLFEEGQQKPRVDTTRLAQLRQKVFLLKNRHDSLVQVIETQHPAYYQLKYEADLPTFDEVQAHVPDSTVLISYFMGEQYLIAMAILKDQVRYFSREIDSVFKARITGFRQLLDHEGRLQDFTQLPAQTETFTREGRRIFEFLLGPFRPELLRAERLIIIPDGIIGYIPFDLLLPVSQGRSKSFKDLPYLLRTHTIQYVYSAALWMEKSPKHRPKQFYAGYAPSYDPGTPALLADSREDAYPAGFVNRFGTLVNNQPEVETISSMMRGRSYVGAAASEARFKSQARDARILHLAMHAFTHDEMPHYSGLVFAPTPSRNDSLDGPSYFNIDNEGFLHAYEIYNLDLNADLAVLSACQTGIGKIVRGEGFMSLARAFRYAGCPSIITSLWKADDAATKFVMESFFSYLKSGLPKDQALRRAKLDYLEQADPLQAHPAQWGTFILVGENQPLHHVVPLWAYLVGISLVLALIFGWATYLKKRAPSPNT